MSNATTRQHKSAAQAALHNAALDSVNMMESTVTTFEQFRALFSRLRVRGMNAVRFAVR